MGSLGEDNRKCVDPQASLFVQYTCEEHEVDSYNKFRKLSFVSSLSVCIPIVFLVVVIGLKEKSKIEAKIFDQVTVTLADYSLELELSDR